MDLKLISFLIFAIAAAPLLAAEKTPVAPAVKTDTVKTKYRPFHGTIKSVDKIAKILTLNGPKAQTFKIISETRINRDGKPAGVDALIAGETLGGYARQAADGTWEALTLNVGKKPVKGADPKPAQKAPATK